MESGGAGGRRQQHPDAAGVVAADDAVDPAVTDGRTARRIRNEAAVVDAMIELITEGTFEPTAEQIADRAGVSHRSVYRYFSSRTELIEAVIQRVLGRIAPTLFFEGVGEGPFDERVRRFVEARLLAYHDFGPIARAAFRRAATDETIGTAIRDARSMMREQFEEHFDAELSDVGPDRRGLVVALVDSLFQFESLEHLTGNAGLDDVQLSAALTLQLDVLLRPTVVE